MSGTATATPTIGVTVTWIAVPPPAAFTARTSKVKVTGGFGTVRPVTV